MINKPTLTNIKQRAFKDYQNMLSFTIDLCYKDREFEIEPRGRGWIVRYQ